jgi:hypothetical protein
MFAIQRVKSVRDTGETFDRPVDFRVEAYMQGSFRVVRGDGDHDVVLRFTPEAAGWIAEKAWHSSQVLEPQSFQNAIRCVIIREVYGLRLSASPRQGCVNRAASIEVHESSRVPFSSRRYRHGVSTRQEFRRE